MIKSELNPDDFKACLFACMLKACNDKMRNTNCPFSSASSSSMKSAEISESCWKPTNGSWEVESLSSTSKSSRRQANPVNSPGRTWKDVMVGKSTNNNDVGGNLWEERGVQNDTGLPFLLTCSFRRRRWKINLGLQRQLHSYKYWFPCIGLETNFQHPRDHS